MDPQEEQRRKQERWQQRQHAVDDMVCTNCCFGCDGTSGGGGFDGLFNAPVPRVVPLPPIFMSPGSSLMCRE